MKTIILLLLLVSTTPAFSQFRKGNPFGSKTDDFQLKQSTPISPGSHLIKAETRFLEGTAFMAAAIAVPLIWKEEPAYYVSGALVITAMAFHVSAWIHVGKAGRIMNENKFLLSVSTSEVKLKLILN